MKKIATLALCVLMLALTAPAVQAATPQAGAPKADKPAKVDARSTPVWVELEGTDSIGARLGMRLKEAFNGSNLFSLTDKDMPKMRLLVSTQSEFPGRPGVGSVYSICWTFTQGEGYLGYLLAREVGTLTYEEIDALVKARGEAKKAKNFAEADRIRDELKARGIEITDVPGGAVWKKL